MAARALFLLIALMAALPACAGSQDGTGSGLLAKVILPVIVALVVTLVSAPYFYRRALSKKGEKNLARFLMSDPRTRDMLVENRTGKKPGADASEENGDSGEEE
jgi:hypothetical protein